MAKTTFFLIVTVTLIALTSATEYFVGDDSGWTSPYDYVRWLQGKSFVVGDVLVFRYDNSVHNVVLVDAKGYLECDSSSNGAVYNTGYDRVVLEDAISFYFICQWHCQADQKLFLMVT